MALLVLLPSVLLAGHRHSFPTIQKENRTYFTQENEACYVCSFEFAPLTIDEGSDFTSSKTGKEECTVPAPSVVNYLYSGYSFQLRAPPTVATHV
jgi:hypothetical protein